MRSKRPLIGITTNQEAEARIIRRPTRYRYIWLGDAYNQAVAAAGGVPVVLPNLPNGGLIDDYLEMLDGLVFSGGADIAPGYYGQRAVPQTKIADKKRDEFELLLLEKALKRKMPIFCICRGHQLLNVLLGGTLYEDISFYSRSALVHADPGQTNRVMHPVRLLEYSLLKKIIGGRQIECNSSHHQAVDKPGKGLIITAVAPDGVIEGLELLGYPFLISVQWHPERIYSRRHSRRLFRVFVKSASNKNR